MSEVRDNAAESRYELSAEDDIAVAVYQREGDRMVFTHTEVPEALEGQGIGSRLVAGTLADVRRRGLTIVPACLFVAAYVEHHPEERDLLA